MKWVQISRACQHQDPSVIARMNQKDNTASTEKATIAGLKCQSVIQGLIVFKRHIGTHRCQIHSQNHPRVPLIPEMKDKKNI
ncbi:MAG: hypothetical protein ACTSWN_03035 [Promethearchaeota archaeon]